MLLVLGKSGGYRAIAKIQMFQGFKTTAGPSAGG